MGVPTSINWGFDPEPEDCDTEIPGGEKLSPEELLKNLDIVKKISFNEFLE